jgi:hypothetical protein
MLRDGLSVNLGGSAQCDSGSYIVVGAYRCFGGNLIRDVCYPDTRDEEGFRTAPPHRGCPRMEPAGLEPATSCLQSRRSTN